MTKLRAYLQLVRLPAVFTAMADIFLGFLLTHLSLAPAVEFLGLLTASSCLYLAGMVFNDVFDRKIDAVERPERPIPSGRVPVRAAIALGAALMTAGVVAASAVSAQSLRVALGLAGCILAYDSFAKRTPLGPVVMGGCRFLNVMLGASAEFFVFARPQLLVATALGIYIVGVTWFARTEARVSNRAALAAALGLLNLGLIGLLGVVFYWPGEGNEFVAVLLMALVAGGIYARALPAIAAPAPRHVQRAIGTMLSSLVLLDASMIYFKTGSAAYTAGVAALLIPSLLLRRWIAVT